MTAHAKLSASSAARWLACPPSVKLSEGIPDKGSRYAAEGTLAHALAENLLQGFLEPELNNIRYERVRKRLIDESLWEGERLYAPEMDGFVEQYADYVRSTAIGCKAPFVALEKRVDFSRWVPEGFGTADCIIISGDTMHVIDLKYGKGVPVSAEKNPQMMLYALGALDAYQMLYDIRQVELTIVQPRLNSISEWGITSRELLDWAEWVKLRAGLAYEGLGDFAPGEHCRFCPARATCRARADYNVQMAGFTKVPPETLQNAEIGQYLEQGRQVAAWLSDLEEYALSACLRGEDIAGWKVVEGTSRRAWTDQAAAFRAIVASGVDEAMLYERKPISLAAAEKLLGKKAFAAFAEYVHKPAGKPTLVQASDKREAITNTIEAKKIFTKLEDE